MLTLLGPEHHAGCSPTDGDRDQFHLSEMPGESHPEMPGESHNLQFLEQFTNVLPYLIPDPARASCCPTATKAAHGKQLFILS